MQNNAIENQAIQASQEPQAEEIATPQELKEVEELTNELKRLLVKHEAVLDDEKIRSQVETLERWMESYRRGLKAAHKISQNGSAWLQNLSSHLKLAAEDILRLESEGGNPADNSQAKKTDELLKAAKRVDKVIPEFENMFSSKPEDFSEKA